LLVILIVAVPIGNATLNQLKYAPRLLVDINGNLFLMDRSSYQVQFWSNGATTETLIAETTSSKSNTTIKYLS